MATTALPTHYPANDLVLVPSSRPNRLIGCPGAAAALSQNVLDGFDLGRSMSQEAADEDGLVEVDVDVSRRALEPNNCFTSELSNATEALGVRDSAPMLSISEYATTKQIDVGRPVMATWRTSVVDPAGSWTMEGDPSETASIGVVTSIKRSAPLRIHCDHQTHLYCEIGTQTSLPKSALKRPNAEPCLFAPELNVASQAQEKTWAGASNNAFTSRLTQSRLTQVLRVHPAMYAQAVNVNSSRRRVSLLATPRMRGVPRNFGREKARSQSPPMYAGISGGLYQRGPVTSKVNDR